MKIVRVEVWSVELRLSEPYVVAYAQFDRTTSVFLCLVTDGPQVGLGCAAPDPHVTGETAGDVQRALESAAEPLLRGGDPLRPALLREALRRELNRAPAARAAVDMALHDLLGKTLEIPVWKLLGGFRERILTSITIGVLPEAETLERAQCHVARGFRCLKIKGGLDVQQDIARVRKLREVLGDAIELRFDANQGYSFDQAVRFLQSTRPARLALYEQPTPRCQPALLGQLRNLGVPIVADESVVSSADAVSVAHQHLADVINIKLLKAGGIAEAIETDAVAAAGGVRTMLGCMDECALGIAAALHVALARPNVAYADLDGHLALEADPTIGCLSLQDGYLHPSPAPGLGWWRAE